MSTFSGPHFLAVVTLLDQLYPEEYNGPGLSVILPCQLPIVRSTLDLFGRMELHIEFTRILSKFLMDRDRAASFWVNPQMYVKLVTPFLKILRDKWVFHPYTPIHANTNTWIRSRRFVDVADVLTMVPSDPSASVFMTTTYYEVGKLAFNLLPILLSRVKALGGSQVHEVTVLLRSHPAFYLIKNDPLEFEKVKAAQANEEFLEVWFLFNLILFPEADSPDSDRKKPIHP